MAVPKIHKYTKVEFPLEILKEGPTMESDGILVHRRPFDDGSQPKKKASEFGTDCIGAADAFRSDSDALCKGHGAASVHM